MLELLAGNLDRLLGGELLQLMELVLADASLPAPLAQLARAISSRCAVMSLLCGVDRARAEALLERTTVHMPQGRHSLG